MFEKLFDLSALLPRISETERVALEAGTAWIERDIFSGAPDQERMLSEPYPGLTERERAYLDGPVEEVCGMVTDWDLHRTRELPAQAWAFLRRHKFFGLVIPEVYGGMGFGALACSAIFGKLATRSLGLSVLVLIPNSVGPGKLLLDYGTPEQRNHHLPRLAAGEDIPCFALTEPDAGSDAASITSRGEVFRGADGNVAVRLNWNKRYITLAPVATLIGLAFHLTDPEQLLGKGAAPGITVALVPAALPGVTIGQMHDPMGTPFANGPTRGDNVVVSVDAIVGGPAGAGKGWKMLMEALSAGRAVSLPAQSAAGAKYVARVAGAYSMLREQFGLPIGRFEGVQEALARIAGLTYLMDASRVYTCGAIDAGAKPSVISAIVKYHQTEMARQVAADAMDIQGGAGLCRGPRNLLASVYAGAPIGITVEGANILTRTLIIFGQGALRGHPFALDELRALERGERGTLFGLLLRHVAFIATGVVRTLAYELTRGLIAPSPVTGEAAPYHRRLAWASARFALVADLAMIALGPRLKQRERLTGRLADMLSWIFMGFATLRRFEAEGRRTEDRPLMAWACEHALDRAQVALEGVLANLEVPVVGPILATVGRWLARLNPLGRPPSDQLGSLVAAAIQNPGPLRDRLTDGIYLPSGPDDPLGRLEEALKLVTQTRPLADRIQAAARAGTLPRGRLSTLIGQAEKAGVITAAEALLLRGAEAARAVVMQVDAFDPQDLVHQRASEQPIAAAS